MSHDREPSTLTHKAFVLQSIASMRNDGFEILHDVTEDCWKPTCEALDDYIIRTLKDIDNTYTRLREQEYSLALHAYYCGFLSSQKTIGFVEGGGYPVWMKAPPHILEWELWDTKKIYRKNPSPIEFYLMIAATKGGNEGYVFEPPPYSDIGEVIEEEKRERLQKLMGIKPKENCLENVFV